MLCSEDRICLVMHYVIARYEDRKRADIF